MKPFNMTRYTNLPIESLKESPFNYRKTFNPATLQELADSIAAIGMQQPIKARPLPDDQQDLSLRYEVVFGHRRLRAAKMAGLDEVPVLVEDMADDQVRVAQLSENIQREDTNPIEEAHGLRELNMVHGVRIDELVAKTGKGRSHIYNTMRLVKLSDSVQQAVIDGVIGREIAVLIATLPPPLHAKALAAVTVQIGDQTQAMSYREAKRVINEKLTISITNAPFDRNCTELAKARGACTTCPNLAGNDEALEGALSADVCTNVPCYEVKVKEHLRLLAEAHRAAGGEVLEGEDAESALPYAGADWFVGHKPVDETRHTIDGGQRTPAQVIVEMQEAGLAAPPVILHINESTGKATRLVSDEGVQQIQEYIQKTNPQPAAEPKAPTQRAATETQFESPLHKAAHIHSKRIIDQSIRNVLTGATPRSAYEVRLMTAIRLEQDEIPDAVIEHFGWRADLDAADIDHWEVGDWLAEHKLRDLSDDDCARLLVCLSIQSGPPGYGNSAFRLNELLSMAAHYGVEVTPLDDEQADVEHDLDSIEDDE